MTKNQLNKSCNYFFLKLSTKFTMKTHSKENNNESQLSLFINKKSFEGQNKKLFELLLTGNTISFRDAFINHNISDVRRRAKDLTDNSGVVLSKKFIEGTRNKVWYMTPEQIKLNLKLIK